MLQNWLLLACPLLIQAQDFTVEKVLEGIHYFRIHDNTEQVRIVTDQILAFQPFQAWQVVRVMCACTHLCTGWCACAAPVPRSRWSTFWTSSLALTRR